MSILWPVSERPQTFSIAASVAVLVLVVGILNVVLALYVWAPGIALWRGLVPLPETLAMVWLCLWASTVRSPVRRKLATVAVGAVFGILLCFSISEAFFQSYFSRPFYPRSDIPLVRGGLFLLFGDIGHIADVLAPIVVVLILAAGAAFGAGIMLGAGAVLRRIRRPALGLAALTLIAIPIVIAAGIPRSLGGMVVSWVRPEESGFVAVEVPDAAAATEGAQTESDTYRLPGILDRDVYLIAIEAYGYTTVSRPDLSRQIDPYRRQLEASFQRAGYGVVTNYFRSPVAGGYSWLAEATLLTGQWVDSQEKFEDLYGAGLPSVSSLLHDAGYYTLTVRPGTIHGEWPEGWDLYRLEEAITSYNKDFGFAGPWFSFVPVTDQYALWTGHNRVMELTQPGGEAADRPLLVYYQLVSSHTPFSRIPPVIDNWNELGDGSIYNRRSDEIQLFDNTWTGGTQLDEGYVAALKYEFEVLSDYVDRIMDHSRRPIFIMYGDHQPQRPVRTRDAVLSTPMHVASRDESVLELFRSHGFEPGMVGSQQPPHAGMDTFFPMFRDIALTVGGDQDADQ